MSSIIACIGKIVDISDIEKADRLELATVVCGKNGKWRGVVPVGEFSTGDLVEVYLPDAIVPQEPRFAFMEKHNWRVKQQRFRGAPSECLIVKPSRSVIESGLLEGDLLAVGTDVADIVGAKKYNKPIPANSGDILGPFPSWVPKTDEPNMQSVPHIVEALKGHHYYITEKVDGMSGTCFLDGDHFGCCTRNWEIKRSERAIVWQMAEKYHLEEALRSIGLERIAIQFEIYGPKIQGNPLNVDERRIAVFDVYDTEYWDMYSMLGLADDFGIPAVNVLLDGDAEDAVFCDDVDSLQKFCQLFRYNGTNTPIEGIVVRPTQVMRTEDGERVSFKLINQLYKD